MLPRSASKPMQAVGMLRHGLGLDGELLALAGASHSGEPFHLDGVRRILAGAGLDPSALRTPPDYPVDEVARDEWTRAGGSKDPITMNCSGKHAAMLATCVANQRIRRHGRYTTRMDLTPRFPASFCGWLTKDSCIATC
jgi:L-asparaginase II